MRTIMFDIKMPNCIIIENGEIQYHAPLMGPELVKQTLSDICEREHAQCNESCPVYKLSMSFICFGGYQVSEKKVSKCYCYGNGTKMLDFLLKNSNL